jgi:hypothetical protein
MVWLGLMRFRRSAIRVILGLDLQGKTSRP